MKYLWILFAVFGLGVFSLGCGGGAVTPEIDPDTNLGILNITMDDFKFTPNNISLEGGQQIRINLSNNSKENDHSFSIGYGVVDQEGNGKEFKTDFLEALEVKVSGEVKMIKAGKAQLIAGDDIDIVKDSANFVVLKSTLTGNTVIEFIVPNMAGEFEFASFENSGKDYEDGMKGIFKVFPNENQRVTRWHDRGWRNTPTPKSE